MRHLSALAFLPPNEIPNAFRRVVRMIPPEPKVRAVLNWFDCNYVRGNVQTGAPPSFRPELWSISDLNDFDIVRTNNHVEGWNSKWDKVVNANHVGVWRFFDNIREEQKENEDLIEAINCGEPRPFVGRETQAREQRLRTVIQNRREDDDYEVIDFLRGIARNYY